MARSLPFPDFHHANEISSFKGSIEYPPSESTLRNAQDDRREKSLDRFQAKAYLLAAILIARLIAIAATATTKINALGNTRKAAPATR